ncbi:MAG: hypothetical protein AB7T20_10030 [Steroidobacteraceae bacterium]
MSHFLTRAAASLALLCPLAAFAGPPVNVEIYDRTAGQLLPIYWHGGERFVAGEPGHEYEIRIRNRERSRVLAVTSVDGVNVITGRTAAPDQGGYVIDPRGRLEIDGWRKNMSEVAAFYFTSLPDSYAARTGRPDNVGVIGVALFRERVAYPVTREQDSVAAAEAEPRPAPSLPQSRSAQGAAAPAERESTGGMLGKLHSDERLGTGHGQRRDSGATYTSFERVSDQPDAVIRIFYDSRRNLVARGVIPRPDRRYADRVPDPFPAGFVPDP